MMPILATHFVIDASVPSAVIWLMAAAALAAWAALHRLPLPQRPAWAWAVRTLRAAATIAAMLAAAQVMQRYLLLATDWPLWPILTATALAVEAVIALYALECQTVANRLGRTLLGLRIALIVLVMLLLAQPVRSVDLSETLPRTVAILVDDSASMQIGDMQLSPSEKIRLGEMLALPAARRVHHLEVVARDLAAARTELDESLEFLEMLTEAKLDVRQKQLAQRRESLAQQLADVAKIVADQVTPLAAAAQGKVRLDDAAMAALGDLRSDLAVGARDRLAEALAITDAKAAAELGAAQPKLLECIRRVAATLSEASVKIEVVARAYDEALYASLTQDQRDTLDALKDWTRIALAHAALLSRPADAGGGDPQAATLLQRLRNQYAVKAYRFASSTVEADLDAWRSDQDSPPVVIRRSPSSRPAVRVARGATTRSPATLAAATAPAPVAATGPALAAERQQTDLAGAMVKAMSEIPADRLAGVLVLSDGRHNAPGQDVGAVAQRLGVQGSPVCSVVMGGAKPPLDAAVVAVDAPDTVFAKDKMYVTARLKLDGLAGKQVRVSLMNEEDQEVDGNVITVPADTFRTQIQLSDMPAAAGLHNYRVIVEEQDGETFTDNNVYPLTVSVTDDQMQVLLVEGRPRWEFRYLKNLFSSRDRSVKLQYVLFEPDRVADAPAPPTVYASATQPAGKVEATALPQTAAEWMKFDVIILGDVTPAMLKKEDLEILRKFVADRGGTLIVIGGSIAMPGAFGGTPLADILPVRASGGGEQGPSDAFRIALTAEGRDSVVMRQSVEPKENQQIWDSVPELYRRLGGLEAKPGATVLAYAAALAGDANAHLDDEAARRFQRSNPLIVTHPLAMGQVMFLAFDQTWRLRYRVGDTYHHKFWGQVVRWATAGRLPAGTDWVKLGADRTRYAPGQHVRVRAKIVHPDLTPLVSKEVAVKLFSGEKLVDRKLMEFQPDSPGIYLTDLGELPSGNYRIELDAPAAAELLAAQNVQSVSTELSVAAAAPAEQTELAPDAGLLKSLAQATRGAVAEPSRAVDLLGRFGPGTITRHQILQYILWNNWPLLVLILLLATAEWLLRKKAGLA